MIQIDAEDLLRRIEKVIYSLRPACACRCGNLSHTPRLDIALSRAQELARINGNQYVNIEHVFLAMLEQNDSILYSILFGTGFSTWTVEALTDRIYDALRRSR